MPNSDVFQLEPIHIYGSEDHESDMNGSEAQEITGVQVKFEPEDTEFESAGTTSIAVGLVRAFPAPVLSVTQNVAQYPKPSAMKGQVRQIMEDKTVDARTASQSVENVIEDLLKKNADLLAQNDALNYKPYSRRGRVPGEVGRSREVVFPNLGQSTTFAAGPQLQGRIMSARTRGSGAQLDQANNVPMGQLMRPKSPTRRCTIPDKDKSHIGLALMETRVGSEDGEKIFHVQKHEMVCAISSETKFMDKKGRLVSSLDIHFYWCNFCPFSTTSKSQLMQHVVEHRFYCKHCRYQSFCRSDIIHHSIHTHPEFQEQANVTQYCTFLSDYLRIQNPKEQGLDYKRKRKDPPDEEEQSSQITKSASNHFVKKVRGVDYDLYDVSLEQTEDKENGEDGENALGTQDLSSRMTSISSSTTPVSLGSSHTDTRQSSPGSMSNNSLTVLRAMSPVLSSEPETLNPVISQVFSASDIPQALASGSTNSASVQRPVVENSPAASPSQNTAAAGRNNLYWSCGYCPFTSRSQGGIKSHSLHEHSGRPYRYVALIKAEERSTPPPGGDGATNQNVEIDVAEEGVAVENDNGLQEDSDTDRMQSEDPPVLIKQEPLEQAETRPPIKVRFPTPRIHSKDNTSLKCFHCDYTSRILGPLRNHILSQHKGKSLVGLGGMNSKVFMCPRVDCTFRSSSGQNFLKHSFECTPWKDNTGSEDVEHQQLECLQTTTSVAEEAVSASSTAATTTTTGSKEEYNMR